MEEGKCMYQNVFNHMKKYVNKLFGKPNVGIHSYRIFNIAYIDVIFTFIGAFFIQKLFYPKKKYLKILLYLFLIGILLHRLFGVRTTIDRFLFSN
tara:strand:+ start:10033 stop:10317 length:285 start_codon:yes stop_codon:yes gene_type:complete